MAVAMMTSSPVSAVPAQLRDAAQQYQRRATALDEQLRSLTSLAMPAMPAWWEAETRWRLHQVIAGLQGVQTRLRQDANALERTAILYEEADRRLSLADEGAALRDALAALDHHGSLVPLIAGTPLDVTSIGSTLKSALEIVAAVLPRLRGQADAPLSSPSLSMSELSGSILPPQNKKMLEVGEQFATEHAGTFMQCKELVNAITEAFGRPVGGDYFTGFGKAGFIEVGNDPSNALPGDIIQFNNPNDKDALKAPGSEKPGMGYYEGMHSALVTGKYDSATGTISVIDSNYPLGQGVSSSHSFPLKAHLDARHEVPIELHIWRPPASSPGAPAPDLAPSAAGSSAQFRSR